MLAARIYFTKIFGVFAIALLGLIFVPLTFTHEADAATGIRRTINFQGKLVNTNGTNVANGNYSIVFSIYDVSSGGTALWSETQSTVAVTDGVFQVELGSSTVFPADFNFNWDGRYLGVNVASDGEMTPRIRLTAAPYAFNAEKVAGLTVQDTSGVASTSAILRLANGKTIVVNNSLTFSGTDSTTITFQGTDTYVGRTTSDTLTNKTIGSTGLTFSGATTDITTATDEDLTLAVNGSGNFVFSGDFDTQVLIGATGATTEFPLLVKNGIGSNAALAVDNLNSGDIIAASSSGTTRFTLSNAGVASFIGGQTADLTSLGNANLTLSAGGTGELRLLSDADTDILLPYSDFTSEDNSVLYTGASGKLSAVTTTTSGQCLVSAAANNAPTWATCPGGSNWTLTTASGIISPNNGTTDLLLGFGSSAAASNSAKFAVTNLAGALSPIASLSATTGSGGSGNGLVMAAGSVQSLRNNTLTIGGGTTGNIVLRAGEGIVFIGENEVKNGGLTFYSSGAGITDPTITTDASGNLTISAGQSGASVIVGDGSGDISLEPGTDNIVANLASTGDFLIQDNGTTYTVFTDGGLVGIGTTSPASAFHVTRPLALGATGKTLVALDQIEDQDIFTASKSGVTKFVINSTGNTYVGALAVASNTGVCWQNATLNGATLKELTDCNGAPTSDYAEIYPTEDGVDYGEIVAIGSTSVEITHTETDKNGNPLPPKTKIVKKLAKSTSPYQNILGITSRNYGDFTSAGHNSVNQSDNPMPIALVGRVPLKVTTENGNINAGDMITSSSTPGIGMKATDTGRVVGIALSSFNGQGVGEVMVFVNIHNYDPDIELADSGYLTLTPTVDDNFEVKRNDELVDRIGAFAEIAVGKIRTGNIETKTLTTESLNIATDQITIDGRTLAEYIDERVLVGVVNPDVKTRIASLENQATSISGILTADVIKADRIEGLEFVVRDQILNMTDLLGAGIATTDVSEETENGGLMAQVKNLLGGFVEFLGKVIFRDNVEFEGQVAFNSDTAGYAKILKGQKFVDVIFDKEYENQPVINISPTVDKLTEEEFARLMEEEFCTGLEGIEVCQDKITDLLLSDEINYIVQDESTKGFRIFVDDLAPIDMKFSWQAIAVKDVKTVVGDGPVGLVLPFEGDYLPSNKFGEHSNDPRIKDKDLRLGLKGHDGLDIPLPLRSDILAVDDGEVETESNDYGITIYLKHSWGKTVYGHLSERLVSKGDKISKGQKIALSGNSGLTTGPHLHFGISLNNSKFDNGYAGFENPWHYLSFGGSTPKSAVAGLSDSVTPTPTSVPTPTSSNPIEISNNDDLISLEGLEVNN